MIIMPVNLHAHTFRCNHASGTEREYIENAIAAGITTFGFSDHAPYVFENGYYSGFRMKQEAQEGYVNTLLELREEYKDKIDIKIGYEAEYYPKFFSDFLKLITRYTVDYLILGQHFLGNEIGEPSSGGAPHTDEKHLARFVDQVIEGISTGVYSYIAHPDMVNYVGEESIYRKHYTRLIEKAMEYHIPLEINMLGIEDRRNYPNERLWKLCGEMGAEVVVGCDAHSAAAAFDRTAFDIAMGIIDRYSLKWNPCPKLRKVSL